MNCRANLFIVLTIVYSFISAASAAGTQFSVSKSAGGIESLKLDGKEIKLSSASGGFRIYDAVNKKDIAFADGSVTQSADKTVFTCETKGDIRLTAEFSDKGQYILVSGYLENLKGDERGMVLDYRIPFTGKDTIFSNSLSDSFKFNDSAPAKAAAGDAVKKDSEPSEQEGNIYPIAAMSSSDMAMAMAIPPSEPREFGMVGNSKGLAIRFYLGTSPTTKKFPNRAPFVFIIYPVDGKWGFRSAIGKYYSFYPDYYNLRTKNDGLMMMNVLGTELPDMEYYGINRIGLGGLAEKDFARDEKYNLLSFAAVNIGAQELTKLPKPASSKQEAIRIYEEMCTSFLEEWTAGGPEPTTCELIDSSACQSASGQYVMAIRFTGWGGNSITFTTNPNPDLFGGKRQCVGSATLKKTEGWFNKFPLFDGIMIDSLGANFPAYLNYRKEHFEYARFPLTCDPNGRVALHNEISHYEFLDTLRKRLRQQDKFLLANGIYSYPSMARGRDPEHYRGSGKGVVLGRFFLASLLDVATSEGGLKSNQSRYELFRVCMGKKLYVPTNAFWENADEVEQYFNKCLVYALFGTNVRLYNMDTTKIKDYHPDGYKRDKKLHDWFIPKVRLLSRAGWEPLTYASATGEKVLLERYGSGPDIYFAVMSENDKDVDCTVKLELESLGLKAGKFTTEEIARKAPLQITAADAVTLKLQPKRTCIIAIKK